MPSNPFTIVFAFKVDGDGSYNFFTHDDLDIQINQSSGSTTFQINTSTSIGVGDIDAELDYVYAIIVVNGTSVKVYINGNLTPLEGFLPTYSSTGENDLIVGSEGLTLSNFRIVGAEIDISSYDTNYLYNDIANNEGDIFFEVS